jgi:uncharacterized membrane protein
MANLPPVSFQRNAVNPVECMKGGWNLIKGHYWLIFAMALVAWMIGAAIPFGILVGPMMCGMFLAFFKMRRGEAIEFGTLFKGFDYFAPSVIATLLHVVPVLVIVIPSYILFYLFFVVAMVAQGGEEPNPAAVFAIFALFALFWIVVLAVVMVVSIGFTFVYPLIVDRGIQGFDAVKLSFQAAMANFWRLLGLVMLNFLLSLVGLLLCFVGVYFLVPVSYAALAIAYEQVFGLRDPSEFVNVPPPPPVFN